MTDLTGTRVYDKVNECEATVIQVNSVSGSDVLILQDDNDTWAQWPRNVVNLDMQTVAAMSKRWDEIGEELEQVHQALVERDGRASEEEVQAAQAALVAERRALESQFAAMRRANAEVETVREAGVAFFA